MKEVLTTSRTEPVARSGCIGRHKLVSSIRRPCTLKTSRWRLCGSSEIVCFDLEEHRVIPELMDMEG